MYFSVLNYLKKNKYVNACLSGILLGLAWALNPLFIFIAFVPLLVRVGKERFWQYAKMCYVAFLIWHLIAVWWLPYTDWEVGILMFCIVPALFCLPMLTAYTLINHKKEQDFPISLSRLLIFMVAWLAYEYLQYQWDFLWSWLTLGNCFASQTDWVWFYTFTGVLGGSAWALMVNIAFYYVWYYGSRYSAKVQRQLLRVILDAAILLSPVWIVLFLELYGDLLNLPKDIVWKHIKAKETHIVIVQPNIDPLREKLNKLPTSIPPVKQAEMLVKLARKSIRANTELVIFPEAVLGKWFEQTGLEHIGNYPEWDTLRNFFDQYPETAFLIGLNLYKWVHGAEQQDFTAHKEGKTDYRKRYNATMLYQKGQPKQFHYKSKRVPSGEYLPLPHFLKPILPAISQTITPEYPARLLTTKKGIKIGSLICYESTYGNHAGEMRRQGADILCIVTEDAYWRDTPQPIQHLQLDQLRALEHQVNVFRASNHGFSGFIKKDGTIKNMTQTNKAETLSIVLPEYELKNKTLTFYSRWGDWIGVCALILLSLIGTIKIFRELKKKGYPFG